jgi:hypothetical protein
VQLHTARKKKVHNGNTTEGNEQTGKPGCTEIDIIPNLETELS